MLLSKGRFIISSCTQNTIKITNCVNLKITNCLLLGFSFSVFGSWLILGNLNCRKWNLRQRREYCKVTLDSTPVLLPGKISWTEEPGGLQSMGSLRVRHDWETLLSLFTFMHWRRKWQPTPLFLPGESQGRGSLVGCRLWGHRESDTTEAT